MIIKKVTRRILAFTLALTLMLALASTASATTVYWTSTDGTSNQATVKKWGTGIMYISPLRMPPFAGTKLVLPVW